MSDEDLEVVVEADDTPVVNKTSETTVTTQVQDPGDDLKAQYKALETQKAAAEDRARAAEDRANRQAQEAAEARRQAQQSRVESVESNYDTIVTGISAAQAEVAHAENAYAQAMEAGNWQAAAKAQSAGALAAARLVRLDEAKSDLEVRKEVEGRKQETQPQRQTIDDPVEAFIAAAYRPPQTQAWLREHREFILEPRKQMKLNAAHNDAMAEGFEANSADYFKHVETFLGLTKAPETRVNGNGAGSGKAPAKRQSAPVAPVNGTGGNGASPGGNVVRLTAGEARSATDGTIVWNWDDKQGKFKKGDPIGTQEMARRKLAMQREGHYDKSYNEQ
jgi:hypothetical protein